MAIFERQVRQLRIYEKSFEKMKLFIEKLDNRLINKDAEIERLETLIRDNANKKGK